MTNRCLQCNKEYEAKRSDSRYCSSNCRKLAFRGTDGTDNSIENGTDNLSVMSREDLETAIRLYPQDTWKDSPEFAELMRRLKTFTEEKLVTEGYNLPARIFRKFHKNKNDR